MKRHYIIGMVLTIVACFLLAGCKGRSGNTATNTQSPVQTKEEPATLPKYTHKSERPHKVAVFNYIASLGSQYAEAEVSIPSGTIIATDERDPEDVHVWGDWWVMNYNREGDTLVFVSGGAHSGLIHLRKGEDGYTVTSFEELENGSGWLPSAKKIFGQYMDEFQKISSDQDKKEEVRRRFLKEYITDNGLGITKYKDFGRDPVELF